MRSLSFESRRKMYNEISGIITTYFADVNESTLIEYKFDNIETDLFFDYIMFNHRILRLLKLRDIIKPIIKNLYRDIELKDIDLINQIKGKLNIPKYIKSEYLKPLTKKRFPCMILSEDYNVPENLFLILIIKYAFRLIRDVPINDSRFDKEYYKSGHWKALSSLRIDLEKFLTLGDLKDILTEYNAGKKKIEKDIIELLPIIKHKIRRGSINKKSYGLLVEWWERSNSSVDINSIMSMLLYNDKFDNTLFEIWILEQLKNSFIKNHNCRLINVQVNEEKAENAVNPLWSRLDNHIYQLEINNHDIPHVIKIYYQKSKGLLWDTNNRPSWRLKDTQKSLYGNLDIVISLDDSKLYPPILIDAKNIDYMKEIQGKKYTNSSVSEKVYKMIGYLDNFENTVVKSDICTGVLIFKNDNGRCVKEKEYLAQKDKVIQIFSIDENIKLEQIYLLTKNILDRFNILEGRIKQVNQLKDILEYSRRYKDEMKIEVVSKYVISSINLLVRGKENDIGELSRYLEYNTFGTEIWEWLDSNTKNYLSQSEYLLSSIIDASSIEYSMFGINMSKSIENEIHIKIIQELKDYLISNQITKHQYFVIDNIINDKFVTLGQVAKMLDYNKNSIIKDFIIDKCNPNRESNLALERFDKLRTMLEDLYPIRNQLAHKDGVLLSTFMNIRKPLLGIGTSESILTLIYKIFNS